MTRDPYGRGRYPTRNPDAAWSWFRAVLTGQGSPVLEALREGAVVELEEAGDATDCRTCNGSALVLDALVKLLDVELWSRHDHVARTVDTLPRGEGA